MKPCVMCQEDVKDNAIRCPYCGGKCNPKNMMFDNSISALSGFFFVPFTLLALMACGYIYFSNDNSLPESCKDKFWNGILAFTILMSVIGVVVIIYNSIFA